MAGVDQHHIGGLGAADLRVAIAAHRLGHPLAVIDIHLAAIGFDEQLFALLIWCRFGGGDVGFGTGHLGGPFGNGQALHALPPPLQRPPAKGLPKRAH